VTVVAESLPVKLVQEYPAVLWLFSFNPTKSWLWVALKEFPEVTQAAQTFPPLAVQVA
jgi:hypothetical protein